jgi:gamma-glutamylcyclotransferase (GGCT)/AIG2-like uncharacterized protein YtfP
MRGFARPGWERVDLPLAVGHGYIWADLYDLGPYPAAIPATHSRVRGEVHRMLDPATTLRTLDEIENYGPNEQDASLYVRRESPVTLDDGLIVNAWVYFYNRRFGRAPRIESGDYLAYLKVKR